MAANLKNLRWIHESPAYWDADKARLIGDAVTGTFDTHFHMRREGTILGGDWWRVEKDGKTIGYGWMDLTWGDAEVSLVVDPAERGHGVGSFVLEMLETEARERGVHYVYNEVRPDHPDNDAVTRWLQERHYSESEDGKLARSVVRRAQTGS